MKVGKMATFRFKKLIRNMQQNPFLYILALPVIAYYIIFRYVPMYGNIIAFKNFRPIEGIMGSEWVGVKHFATFFSSYYFWRLMKNTLLLSVYGLIFGFPAPIIFALLLNEVRSKFFKRMTQTITYLPHFISIMVICGIIINFTAKEGVINNIVEFFGGESKTMLIYPRYFRPIYIISSIWQETGWGSIIYLSALAAIDVSQYEAATIDGAGRFKQAIHITLPGIMPTIVILLILKLGSMMNVGFEKILLLYNSNIYETADVISTFVYRKGIIGMSYSYSAAVGLFNSLINFALLLLANYMSKQSERNLF